MKRGSPLKRTGPIRSQPKPKARAAPAIPKATGRRIDGGKLAHQRSKEHLALVRAQACLVSRRLGPGVVAHHIQECLPDLTKQQGKVSDYFAVPLAHDLHDPATPGSLHHMNSARWWVEKGVSPLRWLRCFLMRHYKPGESQGADEALEHVRRRIAMEASI